LELKFLPAEGSFFEAETVEKVQDAIQRPLEKIRLFNGEIWKLEEKLPKLEKDVDEMILYPDYLKYQIKEGVWKI
jgi:hypothetical protein